MNIKSNISSLRPYSPGKSIESLMAEFNIAKSDICKLASNENPIGPSPLAVEAIRSAAEDVSRYPDQNELIEKLARKFNLSTKQITLGNGSNDILDLIARVFLSEKDESISSQYAFPIYPLITQIVGAKNVIVDAKDFGHDLDGFSKAITKDTKVIWIANPNNPTGTFIDFDTLKCFLDKISPEIIVVLDEAYYEYIDSPVDTTKWLNEYPNLIITRTFSKIYGLAGNRIGYGLASEEITDLLNRVRQPFNVNNLALVAANAALDDQEHIVKSIEANKAGMDYLEAEFKDLGLNYIPSFGNFITFEINNADEIFNSLLSKGLIARHLVSNGLPNHIRVTIGTAEENQKFIRQLSDFLK